MPAVALSVANHELASEVRLGLPLHISRTLKEPRGVLSSCFTRVRVEGVLECTSPHLIEKHRPKHIEEEFT